MAGLEAELGSDINGLAIPTIIGQRLQAIIFTLDTDPGGQIQITRQTIAASDIHRICTIGIKCAGRCIRQAAVFKPHISAKTRLPIRGDRINRAACGW